MIGESVGFILRSDVEVCLKFPIIPLRDYNEKFSTIVFCIACKYVTGHIAKIYSIQVSCTVVSLFVWSELVATGLPKLI